MNLLNIICYSRVVSTFGFVKMLKNKIIILIIITSLEPCFKCLSTVPPEQQDKNLQVEISNGILQGKHITSELNDVSYYGFFGIPYAQPPIGDLRFRPPQPALNWTGVLDANNQRSKCAQMSGGSENCLFINVYTPYIENQQRNKSMLSVMVWIHGGGFVMGTADFDISGPDRLIEHDVIVVTLNYRLGVFGFLSTGDMASPGNYGLKDQIEALKWIQLNIRYFGGDSSQVTIWGESAGAASVHYLLQTPLANGLYHKAISESGSSLCSWSIYRYPQKIAFRIAELVDIETNNTEELVTKLRAIDFEELNSAGTTVCLEELQNLYDDGIALSPCIEPEHENAVITKGSHEVLSSSQFNKVPLLIGFNSQETVMIARSMIQETLVIKDESPDTIPHKSMNISSNITKLKVGLAIRSFYFGNGLVTTAPLDDILDFFSDDMFVRPIHETVRLHYQSVPVYFYRFSYENPKTFRNRTGKGVGHAEELIYIFYIRSNTTYNNVTASMSSKVVKMWTNFAKTGNPTPIPEKLLDNVTWPVANEKMKFNSSDVINTDPMENDIFFLDISERLTPMVNPKKEAMNFWKDLYQEYPSFDGTY